MKKHNVKYSAEEMAETIHRQAMKVACKQGYCEEMEHYWGNVSPNAYRKRHEVEYYKHRAEHYEKLFLFIADLALEAGTPLRYRERELANLMGTIVARKDHKEE